MLNLTATAIAHPNIAFIKYWGNRDSTLRLPANGSISMNLSQLQSQTMVKFSPAYSQDSLILNDQPTSGAPLQRVSLFLEHARQLARFQAYAQVTSFNNFPTGAGIASSASAFAALAVAVDHALHLNLSQANLSRLARRGSGSACRSIPAGFVEWQMGTDDATSYADSIAPSDYWDLIDLVTIVHRAQKSTGSSEGHQLADTSPLNQARLLDVQRRLECCRQAILARDFEALAHIIELDSNLMHAVMITSTPPLFYWEPATLRILKLVTQWRNSGLAVCATVDAGPNVHVICLSSVMDEVQQRLLALEGVNQVIPSAPGAAAHLA